MYHYQKKGERQILPHTPKKLEITTPTYSTHIGVGKIIKQFSQNSISEAERHVDHASSLSGTQQSSLGDEKVVRSNKIGVQ